MNFGLFVNFEDPYTDSANALREAVETVRHAEYLGYAQAWITEHHFNRFSISASIFPLLAHLAAVTTAMRLGTAAVILPLHDIVRVAEDAATVDVLSGGRLMLGVAKGGPFPAQFRHFNVAAAQSRDRMLEAVPLLERLLGEQSVDFESPWLSLAGVTIHPRPVQRPIPIWLASLSSDSIGLAAQRGYGLMGASAAPVEKLQGALAQYRAQRAEAGPPFVVARYFYCHRDRSRAHAEALPYIREFARNMGVSMEQAGSSLPASGIAPKMLSDEQILANAIIGDVDDCLAQVRALEAKLGHATVILKPASYDQAAVRRALTLFAAHALP